LRFNGTFSTNRLYRAFEKYVAVKKVKLMRKLTMLRVGNTYTVSQKKNKTLSCRIKSYKTRQIIYILKICVKEVPDIL